MDLGLSGKVALVTGSTAGIGFAIAETLAVEGASVVVNGRTEPRVKEAIARIRAKAPRAEVTGLAFDLGTGVGARALVAKLPAVDVLVNNLGIYDAKPFAEIADEEWLRIFEVNVLSGVRLARAYLEGMRWKGWGRIIFISSESAVNIPAEMIHYGVTKTAQVALARGLAETTVGTAITVNSILAGPTRSEGVEKFVATLAARRKVDEQTIEREFFSNMRPSSLLKRFATPEEVASLVAWVASERSSATNGAALRVEGGVVRSIL
jgi:NAD(P)-dependent dehydrogenase (short-subunit alcohol dehydrogenase family)